MSSGGAPLFALRRVDDWRLSDMRSTGVRMCAGERVFLIAVTDGRLVRWAPGDAPEVIDVEKRGADARVYSLFVDPTGSHALICVLVGGAGVTYYAWLTRRTTGTSSGRIVAKEIKALQGELLDSAAWVSGVSTSAAAVCLVGSSSGRVYETAVDSGNVAACKRRGPADGFGFPIAALRVEAMVSGVTAPGRTLVLMAVATPDALRLHTFVGAPGQSLETILSSAAPANAGTVTGGRGVSAGGATSASLEIRGAPPTRLEFVCADDRVGPLAALSRGPATLTVAMLTGSGLLIGKLRLDAENAAAVLVPAEITMLAYPNHASAGGKGSGTAGGSEASDAWNPAARGAPSATAFGLSSTSSSGTAAASASSSAGAVDVPVGLALTPYHFVLVYRHRLTAVSRVTNSIAFDQLLSEERYGTMRAAVSSSYSDVAWAHSDKFLFELVANKEDRDVWRLYLSKKDFETALQMVSGDPDRTAAVAEAQAEHFIDEGDWNRAADAFTSSNRPFEEVCLKFIHANAPAALQRYATRRLVALRREADAAGPGSSAARMQCVVLVSWLTEMHLNNLNVLQPPAIATGGQATHAYEDAQQALRELVTDFHEFMDKATTLALMASHGRTAEMLYYCQEIGDYERVLSHHIQRGQYADALQALKSIPRRGEEPAPATLRGDARRRKVPTVTTEKLADMWYRYSPTLVQHLPLETVNAWKSLSFLDPPRLIPALVRYEQVRTAVQAAAGTAADSSAPAKLPEPVDAMDAALVYLEWIVRTAANGCRDPAVHNFLISLYCKQPVEELLLQYIHAQIAHLPPAPPASAEATADAVKIPEFIDEEDELTKLPLFDPHYALRLALAEGKQRSSVRLYMLLGMYDEAVDLALTIDTALAKEAAGTCPPEFRDTRKRLWTRIAAWIVGHGGSAKDALALLAESEEVLRVEDVLAFFPSSTLIDDFKAEISASLQECHRDIAELRREMRNYTESAERVRNDIRSLRNRCGYVRMGQKCDLCNRPVLSSAFYIFSCNHAFHRDCLYSDMLRHLSAPVRRKVEALWHGIGRAGAAIQAVASALGVASDSGDAKPGSVEEALAQLAQASGLVSPVELRNLLTTRREEMQNELDRIIASECLYCGDVMIESTSEPFGLDSTDDASAWVV